MSEEEPYRVITGVFYTDRDGPVEGEALSIGNRWHITTKKGKLFTRSDVFLDRGKHIYAPRNPDYLEWGRQQALDLIYKYEGEVANLEDDREALKISSYRIKINMAKIALKEYNYIFDRYFISNALKYMLSLG